VFALFLVAQVGFGQGVGTGLEPDPESANTRVGTRGATFLKIGVGGRAMGLAGAGATLHPGIYAMYWNPAAMASLEGFGTGFSYMALYDDLDVDHYFGAAAIPFLGGVVGVNFTALTSGDIPRTTESYPDGGDPELGSIFDWTSSLVGLYYARRITDRLNIGGGLKFIQEGISGARANYVGFDAGVTFRTGLYGVVLGATIQNVGTEGRFKGAELDRIIQSSDQLFAPNNRDLEARFGTEELQLPTLFRFTVRFDLLGVPEALFEQTGQDHGLDVSFDFSDAVDTQLQMSIGIEYNFRQIGFLRVGKLWYNEDQRTGAIESAAEGGAEFYRSEDFRSFGHGMAFGGGLKVPVLGERLSFDYAYVGMGELDNVQVFSFEFKP
jgi:hypothetical protein